jgi:hypothetical protein
VVSVFKLGNENSMRKPSTIKPTNKPTPIKPVAKASSKASSNNTSTHKVSAKTGTDDTDWEEF